MVAKTLVDIIDEHFRRKRGVINLSDKNISSLPKTIGKLQNLDTLYLNNNKLTSLPQSIGNLQKLKLLYLNNNKLRSLPESFGKLQNLVTLVLNDNNLTSLPESIGNLGNLVAIYSNSNNLTSLPESIGNLRNLVTLYLNNNKLTSLPESIGNLRNLQGLYLIANNLTSLPESVGNLRNLSVLFLDNNNLTSLPESIGNLRNLRSLYLIDNNLTSLPESIENLRNLQDLYLTNNKLTSLPQSIGNLPTLTNFYLTNNKLTSLPQSIGNLRTLINLELTNNKLTSLPQSIVNLKLASIYLDQNTFSSFKIENYNFINEAIQRLAKFVILYHEYESQNKAEIHKYKYQSYCEKKNETNGRQLKKEILEYISKNPSSDILNYEVPVITYAKIASQQRRIYYGVSFRSISKKITVKDIESYEGSFTVPTETFTYEEIFEQFKDLVLTVFEMRKNKGECAGVKRRDVGIFLEGRFSKDKLCKYFSALEKIYILEMREQSKKCYNYDEDEDTFYTLMGEEIGDVPYKNLIMYDKNGITYCFTLQELKGFEGRNPYTREEIPSEVFVLARERRKYNSWLLPGRDYERILEELGKIDIKFAQKKIYSDLYDYMTRVEQIYPIDESSFKAKSSETVKEQFRTYVDQEITSGILPFPEVSRILGSPPETIHLEVVGALLKILRARDDGNLKSRILLIKQVGLF